MLSSTVLPLFLLASAFKRTYQQSSWWLSDHELFYQDPVKGAGVYNSMADNFTKLPYSNADNETRISFSRDLKFVAEATVGPEAYRHSMHILFSVVIRDIARNISHPLEMATENKISAFKWSHGSAFAYEVEGEAQYYVSSPGEAPIRMTSDADNKSIPEMYKPNGERIPGREPVDEGHFAFSPSDKYLLYVKSDDNSTKKVIMTTYDRSEKYDYQYQMEYTQNGEERLSVPSIFIWKSEEMKSVEMDVKMSNRSSMNKLIGAQWVILRGKELLAVTWANRWYNHIVITLCSYDAASCWMIYEHRYEPRQWAEIGNMVYSNESIFLILPTRINDNAWQHIHKIDVTTDYHFQRISEIPSGEYDIIQLIEYRAREDVVVYIAQAPHPWNLHVYAAHTSSTDIKPSEEHDQCLTCGSSQCTYQERASISPAEQLSIAFSCNGPISPYLSLITLGETFQRKEMRFISLPATLEYEKWKIETFRLSSGFDAIVRIYEGNSSLSSVPVTLVVYGGPEHNLVTDMYMKYPPPIGYNHGIVTIDVRGSDGRGWNYLSAIYGKLVTVEVDDTLEAMQMVLEKYPRFDRTRVGVYGWSYGGTMSIALVQKAPPSFFKCALSVAPVTNFLYYWAGYAETYMGDAPPSSYTDLTLDVSKFNQTKLLLVHGLRDDRVHFRHSAVLAEALQQADIPFEFMVYPNQDHGIGRNVTGHLHHLFDSFLSKCYV